MGNENCLPDWLDRNEFDRAEKAGHRLWLNRGLRDNDSGERVLWVMCNPSTANDSDDDKTIKRVKCLSKSQGWHNIGVANLFTKRETHPKYLVCGAPDSNYRGANRVLESALNDYESVVLAWGVGWSGWNLKNRADYDARTREAEEIIRNAGIKPLCFGVTQGGYPSHPLFLPCNSSPCPLHKARGK